MNTKFLGLSIIAVLLSFAGGFMLANSLNRSDLTRLQAENERLKNEAQTNPNPGGPTLSDEEIEQRLAEADKNPSNFEFQKNLGISLYRYAAFKEDTDLMNKVSRILNRALDLKPKDFEVLVALGNLNYDIGYFKKENDKFEKAREFYLRALEEKPGNVDVRTEYGLTFFLTQPPDVDRAISEFERSLEKDPKHERTLQVLIEAYLKLEKTDEAEKIMARLEEVNPNNQTIPALKEKILQTKNGLAK